MLGLGTILLSATILAAMPALTTVYIVCLVVGGGLLLVSTVLGHHGHADADVSFHADAGVDIHADVDGVQGADADLSSVDGHAEGGSLALAEWFSISFLVYFVAVFGLVGTTLSYTSSMTSMAVLVTSLAGGVVVGQAVHQILRYLRRTSGDSSVSASDYVDLPARVTIAIASGQRGEVAVQLRGGERFAPAVARHPDVCFAIGDRVVITAFANGTAEVVSKQEHDFLTEP